MATEITKAQLMSLRLMRLKVVEVRRKDGVAALRGEHGAENGPLRARRSAFAWLMLQRLGMTAAWSLDGQPF